MRKRDFISKNDLYRYRNNDDKIEYLDIDTINEMIRIITTGPLGKEVAIDSKRFVNDAELSRKFIYKDEYIELEYYKEKTNVGYEPYTNVYKVNYCGSSVYPDIKLRENNWLNLLIHVYSNHLRVSQENKQKQESQKKAEEKKQMVYRIFGFSYPNGYADENITVSEIKVGHFYSSYPDDEIYYNYMGKITLNDGTVVCDSNNNIYIPGPWEDYVCLVVNRMQEDIIAEQKRRYEESKLKRERLKNNNN